MGSKSDLKRESLFSKEHNVQILLTLEAQIIRED